MSDIPHSYALIDAGANLAGKKFAKGLDSVIERSQSCGIKKIVVLSSSERSSKEASRLTHLYPGYLFFACGVHPLEGASWENDTTPAALKSLAKQPECVGIGLCGLDFSKDVTTPELQLDQFNAQVQIACEVSKPLIVLQRQAHAQLMSCLSSVRGRLPPVVIHAFSASADEVLEYINNGFFITITGGVFKDKSDQGLKSLLMSGQISVDHLLLASDAPFMFPNIKSARLESAAFSSNSLNLLQNYCSFHRNEPCSLPVTAELVACWLKLPPDELALQTSYNAIKIFGLSS